MTRIGTDEWVQEAAVRTERPVGTRAWLDRTRQRMPPLAPLVVVAAAAALLPAFGPSDYVLQVGVSTLLLALLTLGLNITFGWAGLLDLSYVAFYGIGAYAYAMLSSDLFGVHAPSLLAIVAAMAAAGAFGLLLSLSSRRLRGDYFAILTLFFAQMFSTFTLFGDRIPLFGGINATGGPGGIVGVDPINVLMTFISMRSYYWLTLGLVVVAILAFASVQRSKTGRAWIALREDSLAADAMGTPVFKLRILAVVFGAATAGLAGSVFASLQAGVYPQSFEVTLLVTVFAMLVAGGAGSIAGAVTGAVVVNVGLEALRTPDPASWIFCLALVAAVVGFVRPRWLGAVVLGATVVLGIAIHAVVTAVATVGEPGLEGGLTHLLDTWVVLLPSGSPAIGHWALVTLIAAGLAATELRGRTARLVVLPVLLYLAVFVWQNVLVTQPSVTRQILLGGGLVLLIVLRPQGLLGAHRVESLEQT